MQSIETSDGSGGTYPKTEEAGEEKGSADSDGKGEDMRIAPMHMSGPPPIRGREEARANIAQPPRSQPSPKAQSASPPGKGQPGPAQSKPSRQGTASSQAGPPLSSNPNSAEAGKDAAPTCVKASAEQRLNAPMDEPLDIAREPSGEDRETETTGYPKAGESPEMEQSSTWDHERAPDMTASFEEYKSSVRRKVEKMRTKIRELENWKQAGLRKEVLKAEKRHRQIDEMKVPPRTEERGPPSMPIPFDILGDKSAHKLGHFIFTNTADRHQELKIKSLCVLARLALLTHNPKKARELANTACELALEFDFDPIFAKAQFWRGTAAFQLGDWATAIEAFEIGQRASGIYMEGAVSETFLEKAKTKLVQEEDEKEIKAKIAKAIAKAGEGEAVHRATENPATTTEEKENIPTTTDSSLQSHSLAAELEGFSFDSNEAFESAKLGGIDSWTESLGSQE